MTITQILKDYLSIKLEYNACWEDFEIILKALKIDQNDTILSISSAGDNVLNFLLYDPKKIICVDYNQFQNYLLELKVEAIRNLDYQKFLQILGICYSEERKELFDSIKQHLSEESRLFWDGNANLIEKGISYSGEPILKTIGKYMRFLKGDDVIEEFFQCKTIDEQTEYFYENIYGFPWLLYLKIFNNNYFLKIEFSTRLLIEFLLKKERSKEYFSYVKKVSSPKDLFKKIEGVFTKIPINNNYFASLMLLNRYLNEDLYPPYLKKESFSILKNRIDRIQIQTSSIYNTIKNLPNDIITKFNLSNIFDWVDDSAFEQNLKEICRVGKDKARLCYFGTRFDRVVPESMKSFQSEKQLAIELFKTDRTFLYGNFEVASVIK